MIKKTLFTFASIFLAFQSYKILSNIHHIEFGSLLLILFAAWIINLFITGIFAFAGFAFPSQRLLPASYYYIDQPNRIKSIYKLLGVELFRKMLLATVWRNKKQHSKFFDGKRGGTSNLDEQSMKSEFGHLIPLIIITVVSIYLLSIGRVGLATAVMIINVIGNLYPIILQRHHRMRIQRIRARSVEA